jgi:hypothetical protein
MNRIHELHELRIYMLLVAMVACLLTIARALYPFLPSIQSLFESW